MSSLIPRNLTRTNDVIAVFPVEILVVLAGGVAAWSYLQTRSDHTSGFFGVGVYLLVVAVALGTLLPRWLPTDNTILGAALLAGLLAADGASLTRASSATLAGWSRPRSTTAGLLAGSLAFLAVMAGGMLAPLLQLQIPLFVTVVVIVVGLLIAGRARIELGRIPPSPRSSAASQPSRSWWRAAQTTGPRPRPRSNSTASQLCSCRWA